jgi:hypothetical protein
VQRDLPEVDLPLTLGAMQARGLAVTRVYTRDPEFTQYGRAPRHAHVDWSISPNKLELELAEHLTGGAMQITPRS